ncbi:unnamed protein product [Chilo suppressalis]|uniref:RING-type domain-containing protein n=1 Tax=Chilo suppressalis TaxID=168631 RepID=A0ABN8APU4_CHISP|nr:unnamed protein product [Chilo suppressalis]
MISCTVLGIGVVHRLHAEPSGRETEPALPGAAAAPGGRPAAVPAMQLQGTVVLRLHGPLVGGASPRSPQRVAGWPRHLPRVPRHILFAGRECGPPRPRLSLTRPRAPLSSHGTPSEWLAGRATFCLLDVCGSPRLRLSLTRPRAPLSSHGAPNEWLAGRATCPVCRATFGLLDVSVARPAPVSH